MKDFKFGLECEFLLLDKKSNMPLWYKDLNFKKLYGLLSGLDRSGIPSLEGLDSEDAHEEILPYVVEGYILKDENNISRDVLPKGVEIRTPVCNSIKETLNCLKTLFNRLENGLDKLGYTPVAISHHPTEYEFNGPRANRRHDYWKWALEVMTTYGPDINISFPPIVRDKIFSHLDDFHKLINYYSPALTALTLSSPFYKGGLKKSSLGSHLKSIRTYRRSTIAPAIEVHENEDFRIEYKFFEMAHELEDYHCYFLLCLGISLCRDLKGRSSEQDRIYELGLVASEGLNPTFVREKLSEVFSKIPQTLKDFGFDPTPLKKMENRLKESKTPADEMIQHFLSQGEYETILNERSRLL
jgi:carboxylate-amine ligase